MLANHAHHVNHVNHKNHGSDILLRNGYRSGKGAVRYSSVFGDKRHVALHQISAEGTWHCDGLCAVCPFSQLVHRYSLVLNRIVNHEQGFVGCHAPISPVLSSQSNLTVPATVELATAFSDPARLPLATRALG